MLSETPLCYQTFNTRVKKEARTTKKNRRQMQLKICTIKHFIQQTRITKNANEVRGIAYVNLLQWNFHTISCLHNFQQKVDRGTPLTSFCSSSDVRQVGQRRGGLTTAPPLLCKAFTPVVFVSRQKDLKEPRAHPQRQIMITE